MVKGSNEGGWCRRYRHLHFKIDSNRFKCFSDRQYGPATRGTIIDGCLMERQRGEK